VPHRKFDPTVTGDACMCLCTLWRHVGICTGVADAEFVLAGGFNGDNTYKVCCSCAKEIQKRQLLTYKVDDAKT
jgi:hypothetical protein